LQRVDASGIVPSRFPGFFSGTRHAIRRRMASPKKYQDLICWQVAAEPAGPHFEVDGKVDRLEGFLR
jgi:hypothetical protein